MHGEFGERASRRVVDRDDSVARQFVRRNRTRFSRAQEEAQGAAADGLGTDRIADVGVWFSPATKTFHDYAQGGIYGMYLDLVPPAGAESWWATRPELSLRGTDHLAGWRGAAYALNEMHVPYKAVVDPGDPVVLFRLGTALRATGQEERGTTLIDRASSLDPKVSR